MDEVDGDGQAVQDFLSILQEHKKNCEREGRYVEADVAKKRLEALRQREEKRQQDALRSRQVAQRLAVEELHIHEFQQFNSMWDRKMKDFEDRAGELLELMRQRHVIDIEDFRQKHVQCPNRKPKFSKEMLELRKVELTLARQTEYAEAQIVKVKADALEAAELERMAIEREQQISNAEVKFLHTQEQELNALRQRIQGGAEVQRKARQQDLERLLQRYNNVKAELEASQNAERRKHRPGGSSLSVAISHVPETPRSLSRRVSTAESLSQLHR